jgi:APA family basic amino acid/polyamine antiporter
MIERLERSLDLKTTIMIGLASTLGSGIFALLPFAVAEIGPSTIFTLLVTSILTIFTAATYAELSELLPFAGGGYFFVKKSFKGFVPFLAGWFSWFGNISYAALSAMVFGSALSLFINIDPLAISVLAIFSFMILNLFSSRESGNAEIVLTGIMILVFLFFVFLGLSSPLADLSRMAPFFRKGVFNSILSIGLIYPLFIGFEVISVISEEIKEPQKNIHKAIFWTLSIATLIYVLITATLVMLLDPGNLSGTDTPLQDAFGKVMGRGGAFIMTIGAIIAALTSLNSALIAASRVSFALSRDNYIPHILSNIDKRFKTPTYSIIVSSILVTVFTLFSDVSFLGNVASFGFLFLLIFVNVSLVRLRSGHHYIEKHFEVPFFPWTPIIGAVSSFLFLLTVESQSITFGLAMTIIGILIYYTEFEIYPEIKRIKAPWERKSHIHVLHDPKK